MVICLEQGADLHMAQLMPLSLTVFCFSKIQIGFIFLVPAHPGSPGQRAVKRVCVCVCVAVGWLADCWCKWTCVAVAVGCGLHAVSGGRATTSGWVTAPTHMSASRSWWRR